MSKLQAPRGTHDIFSDDQLKFNSIVNTAREISSHFGFSEFATPIFEFSSVFQKTLGDSSDIVNKEMYTFTDRGGESLTLRPEGTAGIARAFISNGLQRQIPLKLFYQGPMFRYERPQKGRTRQFHQIGAEYIGAKDYKADLDVITLSYQLLVQLGLYQQEKKPSLHINSIGDSESRKAYRSCLVDYFTPLKSQLSEDSQKRLEQNPLRILDSKSAQDKELILEAPRLSQSLNSESRTFFDNICNQLSSLGIDYQLDENLVRGLDYYTHCVFEFKSENLGAQDTILAGGRYDKLIQMMGGPDIPGVGWAAGIERLMLLLEPPAKQIKPVAIIPLTDAAVGLAIEINYQVRCQKLQSEIIDSGNMSKRLKKADKIGATHAIIIGEEELNKQTVCLKNLIEGTQESIPKKDILSSLANS